MRDITLSEKIMLIEKCEACDRLSLLIHSLVMFHLISALVIFCIKSESRLKKIPTWLECFSVF